MSRTKSRKVGREEVEELNEETSSSLVGDVIEFDPDAPDGGDPSATVETVETADTVAVGDDWYQARDELEARLGGFGAVMAANAATVHDYDASRQKILGVGIGFRMTVGTLTGDVALKVYVTEKLPGSEVEAFAAVPQQVGGYPTDIEEVGEVVPQSYASRFPRPVRCGVSVGHPSITAGTLGCLVVLNNNRLCMLSNNHVLAASNAAQIGDRVIQPGSADGGALPGDLIGILENFVPINSPGPNLVDAAVAFTSFRLVDPRHVTYTLNPRPVAATLGMSVMKNGRTTQSTIGMVTDIGVTITVGYPFGPAEFRNQIGVRGAGGAFSRGGDSGSLIVTAGSKQPVALLFAGRRDNTLTFANPIRAVINSLGIRRFVNQ